MDGTSLSNKIGTLDSINSIYTYATEAAYTTAFNNGTVPAAALAVVTEW